MLKSVKWNEQEIQVDETKICNTNANNVLILSPYDRMGLKNMSLKLSEAIK